MVIIMAQIFEAIFPYLRVAGASAVVYVFVIVAFRLFGKRQLSQLSTFDIVFILLISNAVQHPMLAADVTFLGGIVSAITLFVVNFIFKNIIYKVPKASELLQGHPLMLIYEGTPILENLSKAKISRFELDEVIREHGVKEIKDVSLAVLEANGAISVVEKDDDGNLERKSRAQSDEG
ncbi:MAG: DUF421 domain-containing protein [Oscillospiraceae bacterium]|nr:DUF421 domain-containing protein [Oscillospiraceae bacterium]MCL2279423.1 DUF421 domain-containing protein [Oscillospiraceae bacterium]